MGLFTHDQIDLELLRKRAFNYRWASLERDVIPLTAADPDFPVAPEISESITEYSTQRYFSYGSPEGNAEFKEAISQWYQKRFKVTVDPAFILPVNSAAYGLFVVARMIASKGDNVIIPNPVDFLFRKSVEAAGADVRTCTVEKKTGELDLIELRALITPSTKAVFICNPNNPLGKRIPKEHLNALVDIAIENNLWIVSDEIWADISFNGKVTSLLNPNLRSYDKKLVVSGLSKNFALAGLRIGYILCQDKDSFNSLVETSGHRTTAFGIPVLSQLAGASAFTKAEYWLDAFLIHLSEMKIMTEAFISEFPYFEDVSSNATYLSFPQMKNIPLSSIEFISKLHEEARVALVPGGKDWFEAASEGHVRICYATSRDILGEAFNRLLEWSQKKTM
jgi:aspartate/methionine/tyrosine aminotransferase